jgi:hypothetical protein
MNDIQNKIRNDVTVLVDKDTLPMNTVEIEKVSTIIKEMLETAKKRKLDYRAKRLATSDFNEKNIFAEGESCFAYIERQIKTKFKHIK